MGGSRPFPLIGSLGPVRGCPERSQPGVLDHGDGTVEVQDGGDGHRGDTGPGPHEGGLALDVQADDLSPGGEVDADPDCVLPAGCVPMLRRIRGRSLLPAATSTTASPLPSQRCSRRACCARATRTSPRSGSSNPGIRSELSPRHRAWS